MGAMAATKGDEIREKVQKVPFWWHSIELKEGVVTPGHKTQEILKNEVHSMRLPDLSGKSVLDIGAWDGFFSFEAERRGAASVTAVDHYVWSMDVPAMIAYWEDCKRKGVVPEQYDTMPGMWRPDELPGKRGFDLAHGVLGSKVKSVVADFTTMDLDALGQFDVSLYLGVLYHMHDPFFCLKRLAKVTKQLAIIETEAIRVPGLEQFPLWEFYEGSELNADVNNWWAPSQTGLLAMCRAAGFSRVEALVPEPPFSLITSTLGSIFRPRTEPDRRGIAFYRLTVHAWK
jgi:tRNA (mo5U34)-methyltransferase